MRVETTSLQEEYNYKNFFKILKVRFQHEKFDGTMSPEMAAAGGTLGMLEMPRVTARAALILDGIRRSGGDLGQFMRNNPAISQAEIMAVLGGRIQESGALAE